MITLRRVTELPEIDITPAMIDAGVAYIRESGFLEYESSADFGLVQGLLETALAAWKNAEYERVTGISS